MSIRSYDSTAAPLVTFVSASGGVGKSSLALVSAWLSAASGIETTLLEGDLQFGDMGFWLGLDNELSDLGLGKEAKPISLKEKLSLYKAPCFPEVAEEVTEEIAQMVPQMRRQAELVIADTGQFWSGLTADLACNSDAVLLVVDQRPASVVGGVRACELLQRIGVPASRCVCVYNRWSTRAHLSAKDVSKGIGLERIECVPDGKSQVDALLSSGEVQELVETGNPLAQGVDALLADLLPRMGKVYAGRSAQRKGRHSK